jgi:hypothetical protein
MGTFVFVFRVLRGTLTPLSAMYDVSYFGQLIQAHNQIMIIWSRFLRLGFHLLCENFSYSLPTFLPLVRESL